jgi:hypothetical protein
LESHYEYAQEKTGRSGIIQTLHPDHKFAYEIEKPNGTVFFVSDDRLDSVFDALVAVSDNGSCRAGDEGPARVQTSSEWNDRQDWPDIPVCQTVAIG